jgi:hypothetical protein
MSSAVLSKPQGHSVAGRIRYIVKFNDLLACSMKPNDMPNDKGCPAHEVYMTHKDGVEVPQHFLRMKTVTQRLRQEKIKYKMETTTIRYITIIEEKAYMHMQNRSCTNILQNRFRLQ